MKALIVARSTTMHGNAGGMETSAACLTDALHRLGIETALLTTALDDDQVFPDDFGGHDAVWAVKTSKPGRYSASWWREASWSGPWQAWDPKLIVGIGDAASGFARRPTPVPVVVHCHGTTVMEIRSAIATRSTNGLARAGLNAARTPTRLQALRRAQVVLAAGPHIYDELRSRPFNLSLTTLRLLQNSIDESEFEYRSTSRTSLRQRLGIASDATVLLSAGRLDRDKGIDVAIDAVSAVPDAELIVAGRGSIERDLRAEAVKLGVANRVRFVGRLDPTALAEAMSASDALLFPTRRHEGLPMIILEAAANGLPVIASPRARVPFDLGPSQGRITSGTAQAFTDAIQSLAGTPRPQMSYLPESFSVATLPGRLRQALTPIVNFHLDV